MLDLFWGQNQEDLKNFACRVRKKVSVLMLGWQPHSRMSNDSIYQERRQKGGHVFEEKVNFIIMFLYFPINI